MAKAEESEKCTFLINSTRHPSSSKVLKNILRKKTDAVVREPEDLDDLKRKTGEFCKGSSQFLIVWGGDGTVHQAINSMMDYGPGGKAIGFLRGGTGNGIQDSYEVPHLIRHQINTYMESIRENFIEPVDLLKIDFDNKSVFGQLLGLGYDARVLKIRRDLYSAGNSSSVKPGIKYYILAALRLFRRLSLREIPETELHFRNGKYALKGTKINAEYAFTEFSRKTRSVIIEIGTRPYYGRLFRICPDVVCNDGNMDAYLFQFESRHEVIRNLISIWNGWHHRINGRLSRNRRPLIERYEVKETEIHVPPFTEFHIDGELYSTGRDGLIKIGIVPKAVNFLVPRTFYSKFHPS